MVVRPGVIESKRNNANDDFSSLLFLFLLLPPSSLRTLPMEESFSYEALMLFALLRVISCLCKRHVPLVIVFLELTILQFLHSSFFFHSSFSLYSRKTCLISFFFNDRIRIININNYSSIHKYVTISSCSRWCFHYYKNKRNTTCIYFYNACTLSELKYISLNISFGNIRHYSAPIVAVYGNTITADPECYRMVVKCKVECTLGPIRVQRATNSGSY